MPVQKNETLMRPVSGRPGPRPGWWPGHITPDTLAGLLRLVVSWEAGRDGLPVVAPFTGEVLGRVPVYTGEEIRETIRRARAAQRAWAAQGLPARARILRRFHDLVLDRQEEGLDLLQLEGGKSRPDAFEEVIDVALNCRYYAFHGRRHLRVRRARGFLPLLTNVWTYRHPVGVVGLITPWNYPLTLPASDAVPALLAGNAVVVKPAEETPFSALWAACLFREAGLPDGLFQVITGRGPEVGPGLIQEVDAVAVTGSTETGRVVARQAGERLIPCSCELGGKNPLLILADADFDRAVDGAVRGCFANAGQLCVSMERIYVQSSLYERFLEAFVARTQALRLGARFDYDAEIGSLASRDQLEKVRAHVADAVALGAQVRTGGCPRPDLGPYFYEPTILTGVTEAMRAAREETFGPVAAVHSFDAIEEAVAQANATPYGLNASLWTRDTARGREIAARIRTGTVNINEAYRAAWGSTAAPMGGMKASGIGRRHGAAGIERFTEVQSVAVQRLHPIAPPRGLGFSWFAGLVTRLVRLASRLPGLR